MISIHWCSSSAKPEPKRFSESESELIYELETERSNSKFLLDLQKETLPEPVTADQADADSGNLLHYHLCDSVSPAQRVVNQAFSCVRQPQNKNKDRQ